MTKDKKLSARLRNDILLYLQTAREVRERMEDACAADIEKAALLVAAALAKGNKILLCGNGGSAADSQHIAFTTSGNSPNIIRAIETAREKKLHVVGFLGGTGGKARSLCDVQIVIPAAVTHFVQEGHLSAGHLLCQLTEYILFDAASNK